LTQTALVRVNVVVDVDPTTAFQLFTEEIDSWYRPGPHSFFDPSRALGMRFEPGVGGRLIEVYDKTTGEGRTVGKVTVWEPGRRLVLVDWYQTEIEVDFRAEGDATRVALEHRGLEQLRPDLAERHGRLGGRLLLAWFADYMRPSSPEANAERIKP
jgi:hypothetical protein